jgi:mono/diheme cytochrome c family protein/small nuclear ribonucleoprotein (snRNP)-like protein
MNHARQFLIPAILFLAASVWPLGAQTAGTAATNTKGTAAGQPPSKEKPARADRTAVFLGLGPAPDAAASDRGAKLFAANCAFCHGAKATGGEGPDLVRSALVLHDEKGNLVGPVVHNGRPEKGMPSFASFTEAQLYDLAEFLHMRIYLAANRGTYKVQNVVTGDPKAGEAYFNGAGRCKMCHSPSGDLAHVAGKYEPADLQAAFLYPASVTGFGPTAKRYDEQVTVILPSGESVSGVLKRQDDFNISMVDSSGQYHSWPRDSVKVEIKDPLMEHRKLLDQYTDADMHNLLAYLVTLK